MDEFDLIFGILRILFIIIAYPFWLLYKFVKHNFLKK